MSNNHVAAARNAGIMIIEYVAEHLLELAALCLAGAVVWLIVVMGSRETPKNEPQQLTITIRCEK